jgi:hypothetical protein
VRNGVQMFAGGCLCLAACQVYVEPQPATVQLGSAGVEVVQTKEKSMAPDSSSQDPFEGVFPPAWKIGQRWRVSMTADDPIAHMVVGASPFVKVEFALRVDSVPASDDGVFVVNVQRTDRVAQQYEATYRKQPFSFVQVKDLRFPNAQGQEANTSIPFYGVPMRGFIRDFPALPGVAQLGVTPFMAGSYPATQNIERTADGLRFTVEAWGYRGVITWKRGAPWWSSIECVDMPIVPGFPVPPKFRCSGTLLSKFDASGRLLSE